MGRSTKCVYLGALFVAASHAPPAWAVGCVPPHYVRLGFFIGGLGLAFTSYCILRGVAYSWHKRPSPSQRWTQEENPVAYWFINLLHLFVSLLAFSTGFTQKWLVPMECTGVPHCPDMEPLQPLFPSFGILVLHFIALVIWMPLLLFLRSRFPIVARLALKANRIVTAEGLDVTVPDNALADADQLRQYLQAYRGHPGYPELWEKALRLSIQRGVQREGRPRVPHRLRRRPER